MESRDLVLAETPQPRRPSVRGGLFGFWKGIFTLHALASLSDMATLNSLPSRRLFQEESQKEHHGPPSHHRYRRQPSQGELHAQDRQCAGQARATLHGISFFNQDLEAAPPADWLAFRERIQKSGGVIFVTPEYNRSIPGVLKNAIDVASRPYGKSSFLGKPVGIISNSPGPLGGVSAAKHLQNILPGISGPILGQPEIYLNGVGDAFDDKGELIKESLQAVLKQYIDAYAAFVMRHHK
jgi:chromate reductase